jgi:N-methylhydantoinase A
VSARVRVVRLVDKLALRPHALAERDASVALAGERPASFAEAGGFAATPVFDWLRLEPGCRLVGPAIVEGPDATIVVPPGYSAAVDRWRNVLLASAVAS